MSVIVGTWLARVAKRQRQHIKFGNKFHDTKKAEIMADTTKALTLKEGDEIEIHVAGARTFEVKRQPGASELLERLSVPIFRLLFETFYHEDRLRTANADHEIITRAILDGDAGTAEAAMRQHISDGFVTMSEIDDEFHR